MFFFLLYESQSCACSISKPSSLKITNTLLEKVVQFIEQFSYPFIPKSKMNPFSDFKAQYRVVLSLVFLILKSENVLLLELNIERKPVLWFYYLLTQYFHIVREVKLKWKCTFESVLEEQRQVLNLMTYFLVDYCSFIRLNFLNRL